jgi:hypothetical protein
VLFRLATGSCCSRDRAHDQQRNGADNAGEKNIASPVTVSHHSFHNYSRSSSIYFCLLLY